MDILTINDTPRMYAAGSYYTTSADTSVTYPAISGHRKCDVCIVGGGFTGLSTALHLAKAGVDVVVLEANRVGWGASGRNGGQVHDGQRQDQITLEKMLGRDPARALWDIGQEALTLMKSIIAENAIECDWRDGLIHADVNRSEANESARYVDHLVKHYGYANAEYLDKPAIQDQVASPLYQGGISWSKAGHIHPLKYAIGLAAAAAKAGAHVFEGARVTGIDEGQQLRIKTDHADVTANTVILATNGYHNDLFDLPKRYIMPINNYIVTTKPMDQDAARALIRDNAAVADSKFVVNYYRFTAENRLLFGGGETYRYRFPNDITGLVRKHVEGVFPQIKGVEFDHAWGGTLGITMNRMPIFARKNNILTVGGFSGQGVCLTSMAGKIAADAVLGNTKQFDLFADVPAAAFPGGALLRWPLLALAMTWYSLRDRM